MRHGAWAMLAALGLMVLAATPASAQEATQEATRETARETASIPEAGAEERSLGALIGVDLLYESFARGLSEELQAQAPSDEIAAALEIAVGAFAPAPLLAETDRRMAELLTPAEDAELRVYFGTAVGARILDLERAALSPEAVEEQMARTPEFLAAYGDDPERAALLDTLIETTQAVDFNNAFLTVTYEGLLRGSLVGQGGAQGGGPRVDERDIKALVDSQLGAVRAQMGALVKASVAFTYRDASIDELRDYVGFLKGGAGRLYAAAVFASITGVLADAAFDFARLLAEEQRKRGI